MQAMIEQLEPRLLMSSSPLLGDANRDGLVDYRDFNIMLVNWKTGHDWRHGDFNGDRTVNGLDLGAFITGWKRQPVRPIPFLQSAKPIAFIGPMPQVAMTLQPAV